MKFIKFNEYLRMNENKQDESLDLLEALKSKITEENEPYYYELESFLKDSGKLNEESYNIELKKLLHTFESLTVINEAKLSRIWQHIVKDTSFGIVSPYRIYLSAAEKKQKMAELKADVRKMGLGYIEMEGGFKETGGWVLERSLFIPNISKKDIINLGIKYNQNSVIYKDKDEFVEISTDTELGTVGKIVNRFKKDPKDNMSIRKDFAEFFSRLIKGSDRDMKFLFKLEDAEDATNESKVFLYEISEDGFFDVAYNKNRPAKRIKLI